MSTSVANTTSAIPNTVDTATNSSTPEANDSKGTDSGPEPASSAASGTTSGTGTGSAGVTTSQGTPPPVIIPFNYMEFFGAFQTLICVFIMVAILYKIFMSFVKLI